MIIEADCDDYTSKRRTLSIRHSSRDWIVALVELVSPGNKSTQYAVESFVHKAVEALYRGYHLIIVDLFPPTARDINGLHGEIWRLLDKHSFRLISSLLQNRDRAVNGYLNLLLYSGSLKR